MNSKIHNSKANLFVECSLERILEFLRIDHEPSPTKDGTPPAYWPASGSLRVEGLRARYSEGMFIVFLGVVKSAYLYSSCGGGLDSPYILQDISFELKSGERVGVGMLQGEETS